MPQSPWDVIAAMAKGSDAQPIPESSHAEERTDLSADDEAQFQQWTSDNNLSDVDHPDSHYDYRGFWKETNGAPHPPGAQMHFPDTYKTHGHPTFSVESKYSKGPQDGGRWEGDNFIFQAANEKDASGKPTIDDDPWDALKKLTGIAPVPSHHVWVPGEPTIGPAPPVVVGGKVLTGKLADAFRDADQIERGARVAVRTPLLPEAVVTGGTQVLQGLSRRAEHEALAANHDPSVVSAQVHGFEEGVGTAVLKLIRNASSVGSLATLATTQAPSLVAGRIAAVAQDLPAIEDAIAAAQQLKAPQQIAELTKEHQAVMARLNDLEQLHSAMQAGRAISGAAVSSDGVRRMLDAPTWEERFLGLSQAAGGAAMALGGAQAAGRLSPATQALLERVRAGKASSVGSSQTEAAASPQAPPQATPAAPLAPVAPPPPTESAPPQQQALPPWQMRFNEPPQPGEGMTPYPAPEPPPPPAPVGTGVEAVAESKPSYGDHWDDVRALANGGTVNRLTDPGETDAATRGATAPAVSGPGELRGSAGVLAESSRANQGLGGRESDGSLAGLPRRPGGGFTASVHQPAVAVAERYAQSSGIPYNPPSTYVKVDPVRASRIANAFDQMTHDPSNPEVAAAYKAMVDETLAQYDEIAKSGLKVEFIDSSQPDPYDGNPRKMTEDVRNNNHMWVFSTRDGYGAGTAFDPTAHPLLALTSHQISGWQALANDIFRVVHDYFGHVKEGVGFRADGEENAWRSHSAMYSPPARRAMTSETRGQNSWVNYGPHGENNRTASSANTVYSDQKAGLLPEWVVTDGAGDASAHGVREAAPDFAPKQSILAEAGANYARRPGTNVTKSTDLAQRAIADLVTVETSAVSARRLPTSVRSAPVVRALGITPELVKEERLDLRGHRLTGGAHEIAALAQVARDPRFETLRTIWVKANDDGSETILATEAVSSRLPDASAGFVTSPEALAFHTEQNKLYRDESYWPPESVKQAAKLGRGSLTRFEEAQRSRQRRLGATGYYLVHNHPSGDPTPSQADMVFTDRKGTVLPGLLGHVIINHDAYSVISPAGEVTPHEMPTRNLHTPQVAHPVLGRRVNGQWDIKNVAQDIEAGKSDVTLVFLSPGKRRDSNGKQYNIVRAVEAVPPTMLNDQGFQGFLKHRQSAYGAGQVVLHTHSYVGSPVQKRAMELYHRGAIVDVVTAREPSAKERGEPLYMGAHLANKIPFRTVRVGEDRPTYNNTDEEPTFTGPFYSRVVKAVEDSPQKKAAGVQWKQSIKNSKAGVNKDEFQLVGVEDLNDATVYTKQELLDYLKANEVRVVPVTLDEGPGNDAINDRAQDIFDRMRDHEMERAYLRFQPSPVDVEVYQYDDEDDPEHHGKWVAEVDSEPVYHKLPDADGNRTRSKFFDDEILAQRFADAKREDIEDTERQEAMEDYEPDVSWPDARRQAAEELKDEGAGIAQYTEYQLPGYEPGSSKEVFLTVPTLPKTGARKDLADEIAKAHVANDAAARARTAYSLKHQGADEQDDDYVKILAAHDAARQKLWDLQAEERAGEGSWHDGHGAYDDIDNPIVRLRFNTRTITGDRPEALIRRRGAPVTEPMTYTPRKRVMFLEEIQPPQDDEQKHMPRLFVKNWREIALKWALYYAAENGFDQLAWTTGKQQADRYSLEKQIDHILWMPAPEHVRVKTPEAVTKVMVDPKGTHGMIRLHLDSSGKVLPFDGDLGAQYAGRNVSEVVGHDIAAEIASKPTGGLSGEGLSIGGSGLKKLYDYDIPNVLKGLPQVKKAGVQLGTTEISVAEGIYKTDQRTTTVPSIAIPPALRSHVASGLAVFEDKPAYGSPEALKPALIGYDVVRPYMLPAERDSIRSDTKQRMLEAFQSLPPEADYADAARAGIAKRGWYAASTEAIRAVFGDSDAPRFAALLAALSPRTSVESNLINATAVWANWISTGRPTTQEEIESLLKNSVQQSEGKDSVLNAWINNSVTALSTEDPGTIRLSGPKVNPFMLNLLGHVQQVTNDGWMAVFAAMDSAVTGGGINKSTHIAMAAKIRRVAARLTREMGETWTPAEVQETVWSWAKTIYELAEAEGKTAEQVLKEGLVTDEAIRSTPDFKTLLTQQAPVRSILEAAGYGQVISALEADNHSEHFSRAGQNVRPAGSGGASSGGENRAIAPGLIRSARRLDRLRAARIAAKATPDSLGVEEDKPEYGSDLDASLDKALGPDDGFSYHIVSRDQPRTGYMVSIYEQFQRKIPHEEFNKRPAALIAEYVKQHRALLQASDNYLGGWHFADDGIVYLDVSRNTQSRTEAEQLCRDHNQLRYFDLQTKQSVEPGPVHDAMSVNEDRPKLYGTRVIHGSGFTIEPAEDVSWRRLLPEAKYLLDARLLGSVGSKAGARRNPSDRATAFYHRLNVALNNGKTPILNVDRAHAMRPLGETPIEWTASNGVTVVRTHDAAGSFHDYNPENEMAVPLATGDKAIAALREWAEKFVIDRTTARFKAREATRPSGD